MHAPITKLSCRPAFTFHMIIKVLVDPQKKVLVNKVTKSEGLLSACTDTLNQATKPPSKSLENMVMEFEWLTWLVNLQAVMAPIPITIKWLGITTKLVGTKCRVPLKSFYATCKNYFTISCGHETSITWLMVHYRKNTAVYYKKDATQGSNKNYTCLLLLSAHHGMARGGGARAHPG